MVIHKRVRSVAGCLAMAIGCLLLGGTARALAQGQAQPAREIKPAGTPFTEAVAQAKKSGRPLIVFGTAPSCVRCQALKQGLATQPELKLLMTQYVSAEVPFAGREFKAIFEEIYRKDDKYRQAIGSPSVFIFTAQGDTVYAGPNRESGIAADAEFQKLLISGIEKNGGVRGPVAEGQLSQASLPADLSQARKLAAAGQTLAAAVLIGKHVQPEAAEEEVAAVVKLTGLPIAKSKAEEQLAALAEELVATGKTLIEAAVATAGTKDATRGAVQLARLCRVFAGFPALAAMCDAAWKELAEKSNVPGLREQAERIDKARQSETARDVAQSIAAYQEVVATYLGTPAAELSELRIAQLKGTKPAAKPAGQPAAERVWKSKDGEFSVSASLSRFDGVTAHLQTSEGKAIAVPLSALSPEDQQFLKTAKSAE